MRGPKDGSAKGANSRPARQNMDIALPWSCERRASMGRSIARTSSSYFALHCSGAQRLSPLC